MLDPRGPEPLRTYKRHGQIGSDRLEAAEAVCRAADVYFAALASGAGDAELGRLEKAVIGAMLAWKAAKEREERGRG